MIKSSSLFPEIEFDSFDLRVSVRFGHIPFSGRSISEVVNSNRHAKSQQLPHLVTVQGVVVAVSPIREKMTSKHFSCLNLHCPKFNISLMCRDSIPIKIRSFFCDNCGSQLNEDLTKRAYSQIQTIVLHQKDEQNGLGFEIRVSLADDLTSLGWLGVPLIVTGTREREFIPLKEGEMLLHVPIFIAHSLAFGDHIHSPFPLSCFSLSIRAILEKQNLKKDQKQKTKSVSQTDSSAALKKSPVSISATRRRVTLDNLITNDLDFLFQAAEKLAGSFSSALRMPIFEHTANIINHFGDTLIPSGGLDELKLLLILSLVVANTTTGNTRSQSYVHLLIRGPCGSEVGRLCEASSRLSPRSCYCRHGQSLGPSILRCLDYGDTLLCGF
uniref:MCM OB domain-containing protein n=1 Tax=Paramoeba aestuarina TaxID=180227 RepID=A0A7S4K3H8_9EUKA|mmetsp:Transcript_15218/g.23829  ORF Transcript_15218/g.23829 Transcript_15218/m.23829 type:complete len:384 (+) Transcript_15218:422-1573(+)